MAEAKIKRANKAQADKIVAQMQTIKKQNQQINLLYLVIVILITFIIFR